MSNHGGRQLDGTPATLDVLPECVEAAGGKIPVHIDGGFRTGADIFKALAIGADCCWIGRPVIWGLAVSAITMEDEKEFRGKTDWLTSSSMMAKLGSIRHWVFCMMSLGGA